MGVPKKRTSRQKRDQRRAHWKAVAPNVGTCPNCGEPVLPHRACPKCGNIAASRCSRRRRSSAGRGGARGCPRLAVAAQRALRRSPREPIPAMASSAEIIPGRRRGRRYSSAAGCTCLPRYCPHFDTRDAAARARHSSGRADVGATAFSGAPLVPLLPAGSLLRNAITSPSFAAGCPSGPPSADR